jgi:hypothetical protein
MASRELADVAEVVMETRKLVTWRPGASKVEALLMATTSVILQLGLAMPLPTTRFI